jgi:hypothetical protein
MNYWFFSFLALAPALVFATRPNTHKWIIRVGIVLLIGASHYLLFRALIFDHDRLFEIYNQCNDQFPDGGLQYHPECKLRAYRGSGLALMLIFGWIPATIYIGLWLIIWEKFYLIRLKEFKIDITTKIVIIFTKVMSVFFTLYFAFIIIALKWFVVVNP